MLFFLGNCDGIIEVCEEVEEENVKSFVEIVYMFEKEF